MTTTSATISKNEGQIMTGKTTGSFSSMDIGYENYTFVKTIYLKRLKEENKKLKKNSQNKSTNLNFRKMKIAMAREKIENLIRKNHKKKVFTISVPDIAMNLRIPPKQAENILEKFLKEKKIKEIE